MQIDTGNRFTKFTLTEDEQTEATKVSPLFLALLQNKIADYAHQVVTVQFDPKDPAFDSLEKVHLEHLRLKAIVEGLEELFSELTQPTEHGQSQTESGE